MKIGTVIGTRPHFIKISLLSKEIRRSHREVLVHTGQHYHYNLSEGFFQQLGIPNPDYNLAVGSGSPAWQVGTMMARLDETLREVRPQVVLVVGDTNSSLAGALSAAKLTLPIIHIEAGLRSENGSEPEEINRLLIDRITRFYLCPTEDAAYNLLREGVPQDRIQIVGDILADAVRAYLPLAEKESKIIERMGLSENGFILFTAHKPMNIHHPGRLAAIARILVEIGLPIVWPVHPASWKALAELDLLVKLRRQPALILTQPLLYFDMLALEKNCRAVITDSSGLEREAAILGKPTLIMRPRTENVHITKSGLAELTDLGSTEVVRRITEFLQSHTSLNRSLIPSAIGGSASGRVLEFLDRLEQEGVQ